MTLTFECNGCHTSQRVELAGGFLAAACPACSSSVPIRPEAMEGRTVKECLVCGTKELYVQKDFPHRIGLAIVVVGSVLSCVAWSQYWYPTALAILLGAAALDMCLYYAIGDVLVCYRCLAQYRGTTPNPEHKPFDLGIGERCRQERIRLEMLRRSETESPSKSDR